MSHLIYLYTFKKKKNSTDIPSGGTHFDCVLKSETSVLNPTITLNANLTSIATYNYAYIPHFNRYYFIDDVKSIRNNLIEISMTSDALASYRNDIGNYTTYISRASENYNYKSYDNEVDAQCDYNHYVALGSTSYIDNSNLFYVISISGAGVSGYSSGLIWIVTEDLETTMRQLNDVENIAPNDIPGQQVAQWVLDQITNAVFNPKDYILSIRCFARTNSHQLGSHDVIFGLAVAHLTNVYVTNDPTNLMESLTDSISIPQTNYSDFRKWSDNITRASLFLPSAGIKNITMSDLCEDGMSSITINFIVDYTTGDAKYLIYNQSNNRLITSVPCSYGAELQWNAARSIFQVVADNGTVVGEVAKDMMVQPTNLIGNYTGLSYQKDWRTYCVLMITQKICSNLPYQDKGRPYNKREKISNFTSGTYIECLNPSISCAGFDSEIESINNYMRSGFYYE